MKKILTLIVFAFIVINSSYAQCTFGGNGMVTTASITINGDMSDWSTVLTDPDNNTYDASPDTDAPIADIGRDFTTFAMNDNLTTLFLYFSRAGSATNLVDLLYYIDVNNNGFMQTNEPVIVIRWNGSNGNVRVEIYNYIHSLPGGDIVTQDGSDMPGSLTLRVDLGTLLGRGSVDGVNVELAVPFSELYKLGASTNADSLAMGEHFTFHISSINGSVASVPGTNSINDNFGGCFSASILPVRSVSFEGVRNNNSVMLTWKVADNENASAFEVEQSNDGRNFKTIGVVRSTKKGGNETYSFSTSLEYDKGYYRLKIIDDQKEAEYSKAILINRRESGGGNVLKSNNPVYNDLIVRYEASSQSSATVSLFHSSGALIYTHTESFNRGSNVFIIPNNFLTLKGTYIVQVVNQNKERSTLKALKL